MAIKSIENGKVLLTCDKIKEGFGLCGEFAVIEDEQIIPVDWEIDEGKHYCLQHKE